MYLYQSFYESYVKRHVEKSKQVCQQEVNCLWNEAKVKFKEKNDLNEYINREIEKLRNNTIQRKAETILSFINKEKNSLSSTKVNLDPTKTSASLSIEENSAPDNLEHIDNHNEEGPSSSKKRKVHPIQIRDDENEVNTSSIALKRPTPAQDALKKKISQLRTQLDLTERRKNSLIADGTENTTIIKLRREIDECKKSLKRNNCRLLIQKKPENLIKLN